MSARNFNNFHLGDDVYELAGGLVHDLAEKAGLEPYVGPHSEVLGELVGILGKNKVLRENEPVDFLTNRQMAGHVDRSGVLLPMDRSLHTPYIQVAEGTPRLVTGGVPNWQIRTADLLVSKAAELTSPTAVYMAVGNRPMDKPNETGHPKVKQFVEDYGHFPKESQFAEEFVFPRLTEAGYAVFFEPYEASDGEEIARLFVADYPAAFKKGKAMSFARVAGSGVHLATQFRDAAREVNPDYDSDKNAPQVFMETDGIEVARNKAQRKDALHYQAPQPGLRTTALKAKLLHLAAGGR